ncbi:hypothetical protein LSH36_933g00035 [Paralvinella palmiformis]|uniref:DNA-directed RNA polymerase III subunit RPC9 n=1 Tax=Paralvinella palmiformis TaxID=53620 RepID=A0AAD9MQV8_9ANNE|nr:hypothetical protein LSH36_933g00035 [Paralvinella palmiformis]
MEVIDENAAKLSNYEVYSLLKDIQSGTNGQKKPTKHQQHLATVSYSTLKYLERTPCTGQSAEVIQNLIKALEPFKLTKAEKLQLLNHRPSSAVEIQLMIEESEERLTDQQIDELLDIISANVPGEDQPPSEADQPMEVDVNQS